MKITAAMVPVRSAPFEIETLDLEAPLADEGLCGAWPAVCATPTCMPVMAISRICLSSRLRP